MNLEEVTKNVEFDTYKGHDTYEGHLKTVT